MDLLTKNRLYIKNFFLYIFIISLGLIAPISVDIPKIICALGIVVLSILYKDKIGQSIQKNRIYFWEIQAFVVYILLLILFGWLFIKSTYKPTFSDIEMMLTFYTLLSFFVLLVSIDISIETIKKIFLLFAISIAVNGFCVLFFIYGYKELFTHPIETLIIVVQNRFTSGAMVLGKNIFLKDYSLYFGIASLISLYLLILPNSKYRILLFSIFFFNILFLLLTINRGSIIGVLIGGIPLFILFLKHQKRLYKIIYSLVIVFILLSMVLNLPDTITNRFHEIPTETNAFMKHGEDEGSASTRLRIWQIIFSHSKEFWLFGNNPLYSNQILHQYFVEAGHQDYVQSGYIAHNTYLAHWLKGGLLSLILFLFLIIYPIIKMIQLHRCSYFIFSFLVFFALVGLEDTYCETRHKPALLLFFFLFFLAFISKQLTQLAESKPS